MCPGSLIEEKEDDREDEEEKDGGRGGDGVLLFMDVEPIKETTYFIVALFLV